MKQLDRVGFNELLDKAHIRPRLRGELRFSADEIVDWEDHDFIAVFTKARDTGVLVVGGDQQKIVPFTLTRLHAGADGRRMPVVCDFCKTWRRGTEAARITFWKSSRLSVSYLCCGDLACSAHVRDKTAVAKTSRLQFREQLSPEERVERLRRSLSRIIAELEG